MGILSISLKPLSILRASRGPAIGPQTGYTWAKPRVAVKTTSLISPTGPSKPFGAIPSAATSNRGCAVDKREAEALYDSGKEPTVKRLLELDLENRTFKNGLGSQQQNSTNSSKPPSSDGPEVVRKKPRLKGKNTAVKPVIRGSAGNFCLSRRWITSMISGLPDARNVAYPWKLTEPRKPPRHFDTKSLKSRSLNLSKPNIAVTKLSAPVVTGPVPQCPRKQPKAALVPESTPSSPIWFHPISALGEVFARS